MRKSKFLLVLTILTYAFLIGPMLVMIGTAVNAESSLAFPPKGFSLQWFQKAFASPSFISGFQTSFAVSLAGTLLAMLLGVMNGPVRSFARCVDLIREQKESA